MTLFILSQLRSDTQQRSDTECVQDMAPHPIGNRGALLDFCSIPRDGAAKTQWRRCIDISGSAVVEHHRMIRCLDCLVEQFHRRSARPPSTQMGLASGTSPRAIKRPTAAIFLWDDRLPLRGAAV